MSAIHALSQLSYGPNIHFYSNPERSFEALPRRAEGAALLAAKPREALSYGPNLYS
jgi:hypothetical protein